MTFHPDVLAAHAQFGGDLESMQKCYDWYDLKEEVSRLKVEASKHAHDAETVRRERDALALELDRLRAHQAQSGEKTVPIQYRHDEGGFVEFINRDGPYIVRDIPSPAAILVDMETRQVIGYRVYDPDTAAHVEPVAWATIPKVPGGLRWTTDIKAQAERWQADGHKLAPLYEQPPQPNVDTPSIPNSGETR